MEVIERRGAVEEVEDEKAACGGTGGSGPFLLEADLEMRLAVVVACGCCACARPGGVVIMMGCCFWRLSRISRHLPTRCSCSGRTSGEISRSCWDSACSST